MGFYFASRPVRALTGGYVPTITPREYVSGLADAQEALNGSWGSRCRRCHPAVLSLAAGKAEAAIKGLQGIVDRHPRHDHAHCLLGLAHLVLNEPEPAIRHIEIAFDVAQRRVTSASVLTEVLRRQCEASLLRLLLLRLRIRLGRTRAAWALLEEGVRGPLSPE